jgi:hypothetical protein
MGMEWDKLSFDSHVGKMSNSGFSSGLLSSSTYLPNYGASANLKCRRCNKWLWDHVSRKCGCEVPDLPNFKGIQNKAIQQWHEQWLAELFRVLRPGGMVKAFSSPRLFHRLAAAMETAGFQIVGLEAWAYGSGFPKSLDVAKAIDQHLGMTDKRPVVGYSRGIKAVDSLGYGGIARGVVGAVQKPKMVPVTKAATPQAEKYEGYQTALKSAWEPFVIGKKPA